MFHVKHFCSTGGWILFHVKHEGWSLEKRAALAYPAGAQEGRHLRFLPSCESPLSLREHGENRRAATASRRGTAVGVTLACLSQTIRSSQITYCYTGRLLYAGATQGELSEGQEKVPWGITVSRKLFACCYGRHFWVKLEKVGEHVKRVKAYI